MITYIFKSSGQYSGFIDNGNIFSWNGQYLGWIESGYVWDVSGQFRGEAKEVSGHFYIFKNIYALPPLPKMPKLNPLPVISIPAPQSNIPPITLEIGWVDGF
jgi:hypothetical protein